MFSARKWTASSRLSVGVDAQQALGVAQRRVASSLPANAPSLESSVWGLFVYIVISVEQRADVRLCRALSARFVLILNPRRVPRPRHKFGIAGPIAVAMVVVHAVF